jgi:hypothetical protein
MLDTAIKLRTQKGFLKKKILLISETLIQEY